MRHTTITAACMATLLLAGVLSEQPADASEADSSPNGLRFHVSPNGSDTWSGKLASPNADRTDGPFATLIRARDAIRQLKRDGQYLAPVTVLLADGTYHLAEPLVLNGQDGGTDTKPITYTAYPGHHPTLSGGQAISEWQPHQGEIVKSHLPEVKSGHWYFRQLFSGGQRQLRARWPKHDPNDPLYGGWAFIEATLPKGEKNTATFRFDPSDQLPRWANSDQAEVNVFPWYCWVNDLIPLDRIDLRERTITLARKPRYDFMTLMPGNRFRVENVLEELDGPGQWCLDRRTGTLYFWPPEGSPDYDQVIAPRSDGLIDLAGTPDQPVQHVTISGLTLSHTRSPFPDHQFENFHAPPPRGAAVRLENCRQCRVEDNHFEMLGGDAVRLENSNAHNRIVGNQIAFVGSAGVSLASDKPGNTHTWADQAVLRETSGQYPRLTANLISNNHIHHCGVIKKNGAGIQAYGINSVDNVISHNLIHHMSDKGVVLQDGFGRFTIEYNEMYQLGLEIADTGGIMTNRWFPLEGDPDLGRSHLIRFNRIRDCIGCGAYAEQRQPKGVGDRTTAGGKIWTPYYTWGIYFDNSGMGNTVYGNIIISTVLGAVSMPVGSPKNNRVENNIFISSSGNQIDLQMGPGSLGNRFLRNIVYYRSQDAALLAVRSSTPAAIAESDYNVYFPAAGQPITVRGLEGGTFADWKKLGFDQHSRIADPLFVDPAAGNFRLKPESPALELGFRPIETERIGLEDKYRARLVGEQD